MWVILFAFASALCQAVTWTGGGTASRLALFLLSFSGGKMTTFESFVERNSLKPRAANCGSHSIVCKIEDRYHVFPTRCGSWSCPRCCQLNTQNWARKVAAQPVERFLTLTNLGETREDVTARVREFHRRLRAVGFSFEYWGMVELHKSGLPHWHALTYGDYLPPIAVKWIARESGIGHTDIRALNTKKGAVYYCCKHLGHAHGRRWRGRQVRYSRGFFVNPIPDVLEKYDFSQAESELCFGRADFVARTLMERGYHVSGGDAGEDFIVGDSVVDGEVVRTGRRTMERGYGIFKWESQGATFYEQ